MKERDTTLKKSLKSGLKTEQQICKILRTKMTGKLRKTKANLFVDVIKQAKGEHQSVVEVH